ncbi:MAG: hybrid sensor histidine kinase/response regulator, partial [Chloroflexi bacterium]|nr:hybrid sensor histidine kinase/response regulator [Chloroflexota bacterium]
MVYSIRDITLRKEIDQMKDEFISVASHDLKSPITSIKGYAQLALRRLQSASLEQVHESLAMVNKQADNLVRLINTLLDVSQIQAGRLELSPESLDLGALIVDMGERLQVTTDKHQIVVDEPAERIIWLWDRGRLEQVINNLVGNAIKYSPSGGEIRVSLHREA